MGGEIVDDRRPACGTIDTPIKPAICCQNDLLFARGDSMHCSTRLPKWRFDPPPARAGVITPEQQIGSSRPHSRGPMPVLREDVRVGRGNSVSPPRPASSTVDAGPELALDYGIKGAGQTVHYQERCRSVIGEAGSGARPRSTQIVAAI